MSDLTFHRRAITQLYVIWTLSGFVIGVYSGGLTLGITIAGALGALAAVFGIVVNEITAGYTTRGL